MELTEKQTYRIKKFKERIEKTTLTTWFYYLILINIVLMFLQVFSPINLFTWFNPILVFFVALYIGYYEFKTMSVFHKKLLKKALFFVLLVPYFIFGLQYLHMAVVIVGALVIVTGTLIFMSRGNR